MVTTEANAPTPLPMNSQAWWQQKFEASWDANRGREQTQYFMRALLEALPPFLREYLAAPGLSLLDWGCALGQGVYELGKAFPQARVTGLDFSEHAVAQARRLYPHHEFRTAPLDPQADRFDVIITSNCLEHFEYPASVMQDHLACAGQLYILMVPYREPAPIFEEHALSCDEETFPDLSGDFVKAWVGLFDAEPSGFWPGMQMVVVYCSHRHEASRALLDQCLAHQHRAKVAAWLEADDLKRAAARQHEETSRLLARMEEAWAAAESHKREGEALAEKLRLAIQARAALEERESTLRGQLAGLAESETAHSRRREAAEQEIVRLNRQLDALREVEAECQRQQERVARLEAEAQALLQKLDAAWSENETVRRDGERLAEQARTLRERLEAQQAEQAREAETFGKQQQESQAALEAAWNEAESARRGGERLAEQVRLLNGRLETQQAEHARAVDALEAQHEAQQRELFQKLEAAWSENETARRDGERLAEQARALKDRLEAELEAAQAGHAEQARQIDALHQQITSLEAQRQELEQTLSTTRAENERLAQAVQAIERSHNELGEHAAYWREHAGRLEHERDAMAQELRRAWEEYGRLRDGHVQLEEMLHRERERFMPERIVRGLLRQGRKTAGQLLALPRLLAPHALKHRASAWRNRLLDTHTGISTALACRLRGLQPHENPRMNWYAFAFDTYKRKRQELYKSDLGAIRCPSVKGMVSVVLPVYNGADMVAGSIESVLAQTYTNFELIMINDGSTDNTREVLDSFVGRDERIRVVHQENQKLPRTLSNGFRLARGEFLTWTSDDNRMKPDFLEKMVGCLQAHPRRDMIYANIDIIDADGSYFKNSSWYSNYQVPPGSEHIELPEDVSELNTWANNYVGSAFMYRDRVAHLIGDYSAIRFTCEDYDYWMRVNEMFTLRHSDFKDPVYEYRFHPKSLTSRDKELKITESRVDMMVFDDFRRDFLFYPLLWIVDEAAVGAQGRALLGRLKKKILKSNHLLTDPACPWLDRLPRLWSPAVYVTAAERAETIPAPPATLPPHVSKVLLYTDEGPLPGEVPAGWDLCIAVSPQAEPLPLARPYQGWLAISNLASLFTAIDIRVKSDHAFLLEDEIGAACEEPLQASVIICTYKRSTFLKNALESVCRQVGGRPDCEILVVNNAPAENLEEIAGPLREQYFAAAPERLRMVICPAKGLSFARNAGIAEARGKYLIFIDDDAIAEEGLVEKIVAGFESGADLGVIGGKILLKDPDPRPAWFQPEHRSFWSHFEPGYESLTRVQYWWEYPWGANWCARRRALLRIGGFRCKYGRVGKNFGGGEEVAASSLVQQLGYKIAIEPAARVIHDVDPRRFTLAGLKQTIIAGLHVNYQLQKDLYIPVESSLHFTLQTAAKRLWHSARLLRHRQFQQARQEYYFGRAYLSLGWRMGKDHFLRLATPVSQKD